MSTPNVIVRPNNLVSRGRVEIWAEDELVCFRIGNSETFRMGYVDALMLVNHLRVVAGEAKCNAGNFSKLITAAGNLTALDHNGDPIKPKERRKD